VEGFGKKVESLLAAAGLPSHMQIIENVMVKPCQHLMRYQARSFGGQASCGGRVQWWCR
jgi:hypothetical protein